MTIVSKATGTAGLLSCIYDMHKCGVATANNSYAKASANSFISNEIGTMKTDKFSYKDTQIKNWQAQHNVLQTPKEILGRVGGYIKGFVTAGIRYIPNLAAAGVALVSKNKRVANISAAIVGVLEGWNLIKNTTSIGNRKDYLEM